MNFQVIFISFLLSQEHPNQLNYKYFTPQYRLVEKLGLCAMNVPWTNLILNVIFGMLVQKFFDVVELESFQVVRYYTYLPQNA